MGRSQTIATFSVVEFFSCWIQTRETVMREALFTVRRTADGGLCAKNNVLRLSVAARSREELKEEAREALISAVGPSHVGYRIRLQSESQPQSVPA